MLKNPNYVYGPEDIFVPVKLNFGEFILGRMWRYKDRIAIINGMTDEKLKYGQIVQQAINVAVSLQHMGVRKGQTIAICSENRSEYWSASSAAACTGAAVTTINVGYSKAELKHVMGISKPKYIFCSPFAYKTHEKTLKSFGYLQKIIVFGEQKHVNTLSYNDLAYALTDNVNQLLTVNDNRLSRNVTYEEFQAADVNGQTDTLFILYSSGTTGLPKGVILTHHNVIASCSLYTEQDINLVSLTIAPWYHTMGLMGTFGILCTGRTLVYLPKFEVGLYVETIEKYKVTHVVVVPPVLVVLCKTNIRHDLSTVQSIYCGAAPLHRDTLESVLNIFKNIQTVFQGYGMTECTLAVTRDPGDPDKLKPGSVGVVTPGNIVKVVDLETRKPLGPNQPGEICVKGVMLMKGYIGKNRKEDFDEEGFFKTGDIGYYDDDKYFFIVDRLKELIKYKGYQVPPAEIEAVLLQHEAVRDAGVVGLEHGTAGEVPLAFVVLQPGKQVSEKELKDFVAERLSNPKHLRGGVRFVDQIPKNPSGKILRRTLKRTAKTKSKL